MERFTSASTTTRKDNQGLPDKTYRRFPETITDAKSAKQWISCRKIRNWYKDDWQRWFEFLRTINVGYTREKGYYDIG